MDNTNSYSKSFCGDYRVKHILIKPIIENNMDEAEINHAKEVAKEKAQDIILKLENGGNWTDLVKKYSEDESSIKRDGLMKNFRQGEVEEVLYDTVERLLDGRHTEYAVEASDGYHILFRINKTEDEEEKTEEKEEETKTEEQQQQATEIKEEIQKEKNSRDDYYDDTDKSQNTNSQNINKRKSYGISDYDYDSASNLVENSYERQAQFISETNVNTTTSQTEKIISSTGNSNVSGSINVDRNQNINTSMNIGTEQSIHVPQTEKTTNATGDVNVSTTVRKDTTVDVTTNKASADISVEKTGVASRTSMQNTSISKQTRDLVSMRTSVGIEDTNEPIDNLQSIGSEGLSEELYGVPNNLNQDFDSKQPDNSQIREMTIHQNLRNFGNSPKLQERLERSRGRNLFNNILNKNREQSEDKKENPAKKAGESVAGKVLSKAAQSKGIPKQIADKVGKGLADPLLNAFKNKYKKQIIIAVIAIVAIFLIILIPILFLARNDDYVMANSMDRSEYLYGSGDEKYLYAYLKGRGVCDTDLTCSFSHGATFYRKLRKALNNNYYLTKKQADAFIEQMIFYEREQKEAYKHHDEIDYIISIINDEMPFDVTLAHGYTEAFTNPGTYFDIYRQDLLIEDNSIEHKQLMYADIYVNAIRYSKYLEANGYDLGPSGSMCSYNVNGKNASNIKVRLLQCNKDGNPGEPIQGEQLIDFEQYVLGVVYAENANGPVESLKAQAIAARTYALLRGDSMGGANNLGLTQENGQWILSIRNCTEDQVYCDPNSGCWSNHSTAGETVHSGHDSSKPFSKAPLASNSQIRSVVAETAGKVVVDSNGQLINTPYNIDEQNQWNASASSGKDHFELIKMTYPGAADITSTCTTGYASGEFSLWKQYDQVWGSIELGSKDTGETISSAGCLVTSVAIQIARSGTAVTIPNFNPGTFVQQLNATGTGFTGPNYYWNAPVNSGVAPNFVYVADIMLTGSTSERAAAMQQYQNQGYYIVIRAKTNQHWVALDRVEGGTVYIFDPGSNAVSLWDKYPLDGYAIKNGTRIGLYKNNG